VLNHSEREDGCLVLDIGSQLTVAGVFASGSLQCLDVVAVGGSDMKADFKDDPAFNRMLGAVRSKIAPFTQGGRSLRTIAVVGGMSFADGFIEALEEKLSHPVKIGVVKDIRGELPGQENVRLATAIGLVKYAHEKRCQGIRDARTAAKRLTEKVVDLLNNYF
jgi:cell division ATPase FtsA